MLNKDWHSSDASPAGGQGGSASPIFVFAPPIYFLPFHGIFLGGKSCCFWPEKTFKFVTSARKSLRISAKTFYLFFGDYLIFTETLPQSNSGIMKIWVKFNVGFQLCPPDFNFAPPPPPPDLVKLATPLALLPVANMLNILYLGFL